MSHRIAARCPDDRLSATDTEWRGCYPQSTPLIPTHPHCYPHYTYVHLSRNDIMSCYGGVRSERPFKFHSFFPLSCENAESNEFGVF
jgi:hypothetical protein